MASPDMDHKSAMPAQDAADIMNQAPEMADRAPPAEDSMSLAD